MKLFAIKDKDNELYFQIEKTKDSLKIIDNVAYELFGEEGYRFENRWQSGLPEKEDYEGYDIKGIYLGIVLSEKRVHFIFKGLKNKVKKDKIKEIIAKKYKF